MLYYSKTTGGFYSDAIHKSIPADAVKITAEKHQALLLGQSQGRRIVAGVNGPELQDSPPFDWRPPAMGELRTRRDRLLDVVSGMQSDYLTAGDTTNAALCKSVKQGLKDITVWPAIVGAASRADFDSAVVTRWLEIATPAPLAVKLEFKRYAGGEE